MEVKYYISGSFLCSMHMVLVCKKYTRAPLSLLRGVLNIDFRKAQTERESSRRTSASRADLRLRELWGKESEAKEPKSVL